jgi:ParB/RepB/Spo0J family partition protein
MGKDEGRAIARDTQPAELATLQRSAIVRSTTNPRTHFDEAYINELATSIREHGILQPILVRPLPPSRLEETSGLTPRPTHEIVAGECRWRAAGVAEVASMPVLIRHLDDLQVLQVQLVENLKRRDLHPLEEAEGFERLINDHRLQIADIAARIDKSESYIYKAMKLLELTPECREKLYAGKLSQSTALLVARAPAHLQAKIAKDIMEDGFDDEPMSFRQASRYIHDHYMLRLADAVFDIKDASLVAKVGPCGTCPKNTGANKDLFGDVTGGDSCTDSKCFDSKKVAHYAAVAKTAEAKGQKVIQGKEAKELMPHSHSDPKGYTPLDKKQYIDGVGYTSLRTVIGKELPPPVIIINPHTKEAVEVLPTSVANGLVKKKTAAKAAADKSGTTTAQKKKEPTKQELEAEFEASWKAKAAREIFAAARSGKMKAISVEFARQLGAWMCDQLPYGELGELVDELLEVGKIGKNAGAEEYFKKCPDHHVAPALLLVVTLIDMDTYTKEMPLADVIARDAGVDFKKLQDQVKVEMKAAAPPTQRPESAKH